MQGTLSCPPPGILGLPGGRGASLALRPPSPSLDGTWRESAGCCFYPAAPAPGPGDTIFTFFKHSSNMSVKVQWFSKVILTFSFTQARAAAAFSAVTRFLAVAEKVIFSGQCRVSSHFFSFPPVVLNCITSCTDKRATRVRPRDELRALSFHCAEDESYQPGFCWMMWPTG